MQVGVLNREAWLQLEGTIRIVMSMDRFWGGLSCPPGSASPSLKGQPRRCHLQVGRPGLAAGRAPSVSVCQLGV